MTSMPKSSSLWQKHSAELVVLSSLHTEIALPMSWEGGTVSQEGCECTKFRSISLCRSSDEIAWHSKHYTERRVSKFYDSGAALAVDVGVLVSKMEESTEAHIQASLKIAQDPDEEPFPAYLGGNYSDEAFGKMGSGQKFHRNVIVGADFEHATARGQTRSIEVGSGGTSEEPWTV